MGIDLDPVQVYREDNTDWIDVRWRRYNDAGVFLHGGCVRTYLESEDWYVSLTDEENNVVPAKVNKELLKVWKELADG